MYLLEMEKSDKNPLLLKKKKINFSIVTIC